MKKTLAIILGLMLISTAGLQALTVSGLVMTNIAKITAGNAPIVTPVQVIVTNATMYGGSVGLTAGRVQGISAFTRSAWFFSVTNYGNSSANFVAKVVASNYRLGGALSSWAWGMSNASIAGLSPLGVSTIGLFITNKSPVSNNAFFSLLVKISNQSALQASRAYRGMDGTTWFGGILGIKTNWSATNAATFGPVMYLQGAGTRTLGTNAAGYVTAIASGPVLVISKWIQAVTHPSSGLGLTGYTYAEPGSIVLYYINVTNKGGAAATSSKIVDSFSTNFLLVDYTNGSGYGHFSTANSGAFTFVTFTNNLFTGNDRIKIRVKIR
jgi:uncharacterized repeat protein (TIGR01451 family)